MKALIRCLARMLVVRMFGVGVPLPATAGIVSTDQVQGSSQRGHIRNLLERADVRARMPSLGVDADAAPAGGDGVLEVLLIVFLALLLTDILGFAKVFPFTGPIK